jgi:4-amino-4-deoxy-L-arabinose transferase-like glycosyltransferase
MSILAPAVAGTHDGPHDPLSTPRPLARIRAGITTSAIAAGGVSLLAAVLYLWNLTASGFANTYYSAAALAASQSWTAWFFGSLDAGNFITVDKPPLATMLMGLFVRSFGLSSLSILLPEALLGVGSVLILFDIVRRQFGTAAATIAGVVMALTPVAVLMFRYDHPDALLVFLILLGAWAVQRAIEDGRHRWLVLAGVSVGLAFLT